MKYIFFACDLFLNWQTVFINDKKKTITSAADDAQEENW